MKKGRKPFDYYVLDAKDITHIIGIESKEEIMRRYGIESKKKFKYILEHNVPVNGVTFVECVDMMGRVDKFDNVLFHERVKSGMRYYVNRHGYVFSTDKNGDGKRILKTCFNEDGKVILSCNGRKYSLGRLVAKNFVEGYGKYKVVAHIDGDEANNDFTNLKWMTRSEYAEIHECNDKRCIRVGLFEDGKKVREFKSVRQASRELLIDRKTIRAYVDGRFPRKELMIADLRRV